MNYLTDTLKTILFAWGELTEVVLNTFSLLVTVTGVLISMVKSVQERKRSPGIHPLHTYFRKLFGGWLIVALEFQLAADIVATIVSPTSGHLIQLGAVALIRTFLNYFLNKELREDLEVKYTGYKKTKERTVMQELHVPEA